MQGVAVTELDSEDGCGCSRQILKDRLFYAWLALGGLACLHPAIGAGPAIIGGMLGAVFFNRGLPGKLKKQPKRLLQLGVIGLGFTLHLGEVLGVGLPSMLVAAATISGTFVLAHLASRFFKVDRTSTTLIAAGTAICGGSAIAAVGAAVRAKPNAMTLALGTVFLLNASAVVVFPLIGQSMNLDPHLYGQWVGFAIHDVSSVVGAADAMGDEALQTATTVKLARTLWIIPLTLGIVATRRWLWRCGEGDEAEACHGPRWRTAPWFILGFLIASALTTASPAVNQFAPLAVDASKAVLTLSLFYIGASIDRSAFRRSNLGPIGLGCLLWVTVSVVGFAWLS